jgi:spermidine synthase
MDPMTRAPTIPNPNGTTVLLGVSTVTAQALLLREAMAAMGGSEIAWGLVMALWLGGMGLGARIGGHAGSVQLARWLPSATLVLSAIGIVLYRAAPVLLGRAPGETLTTWHAIWLWAVAIVPAASAGGLAFPILAGALGDRGGGRAYTFEAAGALAGGVLLSFGLLPFGTAVALVTMLTAITAIAVWPRHRGAALLIIAAGAAATPSAGDWLAHAGWRWAGHPDPLGGWAETRHQRLEYTSGEPVRLYADGRLEASYPEPYTVHPRAHLLMLLHPAPERVLAIGCAVDGSLDAMVRHPVAEIVVVEEDPQMIELLGEWYGNGFRSTVSSPQVTIRTDDPLRAISSERDLDLIILTDSDPATLRGNRTRTTEFFRHCRRALSRDGIVAVQVGVADTYLGGTAGELIATLASTLKVVFPNIAALPGESVMLLAGGPDARLDVSVGVLNERRLDRPEIADGLHPAMLPLLLDESRRPEIEHAVTSASVPPNTIRRPRAVPQAAWLHEARARSSRAGGMAAAGRWLPVLVPWIAAAIAVGLVGLRWTERGSVRAVGIASVVGLVSMGWWLLLLASWQTTRGSVYTEIGLLTGLFMAGVAVGGWIGLRATSTRSALPWALALGTGVSLAIGLGAPIALPVLLVPILLVTAGGLTGATFPALAEMAGADRRGAGLAFAADEIGAAAAALAIGTIAIPQFGMTATSLALAALGLAAIPAALKRQAD